MRGFCTFISFLFVISVNIHTAYAQTYHAPYLPADECIKCHPRANPTHAITSPRRPVPGDMPLDKNMITCITCHNCISGTCILRRLPVEICHSCHDCTQGMACLIGVAHLGNAPNINAIVKGCTKNAIMEGALGAKVSTK